MLEIADDRTGRRTRAARGGLVTLYEHLALPKGVVTPEDMRVLVVGDVLLRTVERGGGQVVLRCAVPADTAEENGLDRFWKVIAGLGVHPPSEVVADRDAATSLGGPSTIQVSAEPPQDTAEGGWLRVGPVLQPLADQAWWVQGADALAVRLALLATPHAAPVRASAHELAAAYDELNRWRTLVAHWATHPSRPVPADVRHQADTALSDDLGTPAVLALLRTVEKAEDIPPGAKFETFALLDGVLGLDLARTVGQDEAEAGTASR
jgi:hypothetical protein